MKKQQRILMNTIEKLFEKLRLENTKNTVELHNILQIDAFLGCYAQRK